MSRKKVLWITVLVISVILLIGYCLWYFNILKVDNYSSYGRGYYGRSMMGRWYNSNSGQSDSGKKISVDQIENVVKDYIQGYGNNLVVSDIFVYKNSDYYVSVEEKDTGKGAMELLVNPYTGQVYPEYGPNMMWNEKYGMHGGYVYDDNNDQISREQAVKIADDYVKDSIGNEFSVSGDGHEFYGYYTFHIEKDNVTVGMISVNYYTRDLWFHDWHGELEQVISHHKK